MSAQDKICSDIFQKWSDISTVALYFGSDICQIKLRFVQVNLKSARKMSDVRLLFHALVFWIFFLLPSALARGT